MEDGKRIQQVEQPKLQQSAICFYFWATGLIIHISL